MLSIIARCASSTSLVLPLALLACAGCSSSGSGTCGDGSCQPGESCTSCQSDCGPCTDDCAEHCTNGALDCEEEDIDCGGACMPCFDADIRAGCGSALNHEWTGDHEVVMSNPDGSPFTGDVMEPEYREYGGQRWMFFNDTDAGPTGKDLYYGVWSDAEGAFVVPGLLGGNAVNTAAVDGNPTLDQDGHFYFVSTRDFTSDQITAHGATLVVTPGTPPTASLSGVAKVSDLSRHQLPWINMGVQVSWDGALMLFSEAYFDTTPPSQADIGMADRAPGGGAQYLRRADMATILAAVNSAEHLEYAPYLSHDGLELYFTRLVYLGTAPTDFATCQMVAKRSAATEPFDAPAVIAAIAPQRSLLHEAPSLTPDGAMLYYHKRSQGSQRVALWAVSRVR